MVYLCPKCNRFMHNISLSTFPAKSYYYCFDCGYKSKVIDPVPSAQVLPKELQPESEENDEIQSVR